MEAIMTAFYMTMELWIFLGILMTALIIEEIVREQRNG